MESSAKKPLKPFFDAKETLFDASNKTSNNTDVNTGYTLLYYEEEGILVSRSLKEFAIKFNPNTGYITLTSGELCVILLAISLPVPDESDYRTDLINYGNSIVLAIHLGLSKISDIGLIAQTITESYKNDNFNVVSVLKKR